MESPRITTRVENEILEAIKIHPDFDGVVSNFVTEALMEKLGKKDSFKSGFANMLNKVDKLETKTIEQKIIDLEISSQIIFEELKKQNELFTIIHRRATLAAGYLTILMTDIKKSEEIVNIENRKLNQIVDKESNEIQLTIRRK